MAKGQFHLSPEGPAPCGVTTGQCPYEPSGHYGDAAQAESAFAESQGGALPVASRKAPERVVIETHYGQFPVANGDLSNPMVRGHFANGLCADLANAIHELDPSRKVYLAIDGGRSGPYEEDLQRMKDISEITNFIMHAVVESKEHPGRFLDGYGVKSREEIEDFFENPLREAPIHIFRDAHSGADHDLSGFARAALELEHQGTSYEYSFDDFYE